MYPNIEAERARRNLTLEQLSKQLGVERKTIYTWQKYGKIPAPKLIEMADLFECSTDYLLGRVEDRNFNTSRISAHNKTAPIGAVRGR